MKPVSSFRNRFLPSSFLIAISLSISHAATFRWDAGDTANGATIDAASGTWDKTAGNIVWNDASANKIWADSNDAIFEGIDGIYAITVGTTIAATKLIFNNSGYTLSAGSAQTITLTPGSTSAIEITIGKSATIGSNVAVQKAVVNTGTGGLTIGATGGAAAGKLTIASGAIVRSTSSGGNSAMYLSGNGLVVDVSGSLGRTSSAVGSSGGNDDTTHIASNATDNVTLNLKTGGSYATGGRTMRIGSTGTAVMNVDGGAFSMHSSATHGHVYLGYNAGSNATVNVSSGSFSTNPGAPATGQGQLIVGLNATSTALLSVTGGIVNAYGRMVVSNGSTNATATLSGTGEIIVGGIGMSIGEGAAGAKGIFNLNGGILTTPSINRVMGEATFNLDGGTLKSSKSNASFMTGLTVANVHNNGAIVDSNGFDITIDQALTHSVLPGANAIDGGLTKIGPGELTISNTANTYTGPTTINAGSLALANVGIPNQSGLTVGSAGTLKVKGIDPVTTAGTFSSQGKVDFTGTAGTANNLTTGGDISLNASTLHFDLFDDGADRITATGAATNTGINTVNISLAPGEPVVNGTHTLISATGGLSVANFAIGAKPAGFSTYSLSTPTPTELILNVLAGNPTPGTAYWTGSASSTGAPADAENLWGYGSTLAITKSNWSTNAAGTADPLQIPGADTDVIFSASNATGTAGDLTTKLDGGYSLNSLTFAVPAATSITSTTINTNGFPLTLGINGLTLSSASNSSGIVNGTGSVVINGDQSWSNHSDTRSLTIAVPATCTVDTTVLNLDGTGAGGLNIASLGDGTGKLRLISNQAGLTTLSGIQTFTGPTEIFAGRMLLDNLAAFPSTLTIGSALTDALTIHQTSQNLVLPNTVIAGEGGIVKTGAGSLTLTHGASSYSGGTAVNGGTLLVNGSTGAGTLEGGFCTVGLMTPANAVTVADSAILSINGTAPFGNSLMLPEFCPSITVNAGGTLHGNAFVAFLPNLTLNGGSVVVGAGNTTGGFNTNLGLVGTVTVGGSNPSTISTPVVGGNSRISLGAGLATNNGVIFDIADVTGDSAVDFTISSIVRNAGSITVPLVSPLTKTGPGSMLLSAANIYTGTTTVSAGELILGSASLADAADVVIGASATLNLTHGASDTVHALTIGGVQMPAGTYGPAGTANSHLTGTGSLVVTTGPATGYDTWSLVIPNAADRDRTDDPDGDGFNNRGEYLFGTSPVVSNGSLTQTSTSGSDLVVRWSQRNTGTFVLQESSTLLDNPWPASAAPVGNATDQSGLYSPDYTRKEAVVPIDSARKFVRIFATE
ncbi:MAG: autotransporter-associated beta strand repeat-containing protein [Verrucomicrobiota bacterium]